MSNRRELEAVMWSGSVGETKLVQSKSVGKEKGESVYVLARLQLLSTKQPSSSTSITFSPQTSSASPLQLPHAQMRSLALPQSQRQRT